MIDYFSYFPAKIRTELRTMHCYGDDSTIFPEGTYLFGEAFCSEPGCDCQRVLIRVLHFEHEGDPLKEVANISYTWNTEQAKMMSELLQAPNPFLDPLHYQAPVAVELLKFWSKMLKHDQNYAARLQRHYYELRAALPSPSVVRADLPHQSPASPHLTPSDRKRRQRLLKQKKKNPKGD